MGARSLIGEGVLALERISFSGKGGLKKAGRNLQGSQNKGQHRREPKCRCKEGLKGGRLK